MRETFRNTQVLVLDDFLPKEEFDALRAYLQLEDYDWIRSNDWDRVWRITDGDSLKGPEIYSHDLGLNKHHYPSGSGMDMFLERILKAKEIFAPWVGVFSKEWRAVTAQPFLFPQGTRLSWHGDPPDLITGGYVFYVHDQWNIQWGGELFIEEEAASEDMAPTSSEEKARIQQLMLRQSMDNSYLNEVLSDPGMGRFFMPIPNRVILFTAGTRHMVNRVDPNAGDTARHTISGSFRR
jgi:Rps23 Pro-64 3,4-dihydroxylase Tpa1-like proline 4-hydroxylase